MKDEDRRRRRTRSWIGFHAVVGYSEFRQGWKQTDQVDPAPLVPLANPALRNVVSAPGDSRANARDMEFGSREGDVPHANLDPLCECCRKEAADCVPSEGRFNGEDKALRLRGLEEARALLPRGYIGIAF